MNHCFPLPILTGILLGIPLFSTSQTLSAGPSFDVNNFHWSIAGNEQGQSPNILSELKFKNIITLGFFAGGTCNVTNRLRLEAYYQRNGVLNGHGTDTDYENDNRTNPTFQQPFESDKGYLSVFSAGADYTLLQRRSLSVSAGAAYKNTSQQFYLLSQDLPDLKSTYTARWRGPAIKIRGNYKCTRSLSAEISIAYTNLWYRGTANWNMIAAFMHPVSFVQTAKGYGMEYRVQGNYAINSYLTGTLALMAGNTSISRGTDITYLTTGNQLRTQFNGAKNDNYNITLGITLQLSHYATIKRKSRSS
ncbi:hypothetical protein [Chitinophaga sp.]|uniref:hypothetical protein n=1 Tax=Chitinophaga sp. TaxID=1869181 RepID=UPI0031D8ECAC